jgi:hypothetical protein
MLALAMYPPKKDRQAHASVCHTYHLESHDGLISRGEERSLMMVL